MRGLKVSPDGKYVLATHFMARYQVPVTQLERGWVSTNALSVIRVSDRTLIYTVLLDDLMEGFPNPWAIGFSSDGRHLLTTAAGSHELSLINLPELIRKVEAEATHRDGAANLAAHNNLTFLSGIRKRIALKGNGPRALTVKGSTAYVAHYFSVTIDVVDFSNPDAVTVETLNLNPGMKITQERQGEILFNDASISLQTWISCSTCHPDGRADGLNWDIMNDGIGNPKNVKSVLLSHLTPPTSWRGVRANVGIHTRKALQFTLFAARPEKEALAIEAYMKGIKPMPSPFLINGKPSESALRGREVFEDLDCTRCHSSSLLTDLKMHDVGTSLGVDSGHPINTPSLIELWRSAPYLHDGRAATIHDVLLNEPHADMDEDISTLNKDQINDLVSYLLSL